MRARFGTTCEHSQMETGLKLVLMASTLVAARSGVWHSHEPCIVVQGFWSLTMSSALLMRRLAVISTREH